MDFLNGLSQMLNSINNKWVRFAINVLIVVIVFFTVARYSLDGVDWFTKRFTGENLQLATTMDLFSVLLISALTMGGGAMIFGVFFGAILGIGVDATKKDRTIKLLDAEIQLIKESTKISEPEQWGNWDKLLKQAEGLKKPINTKSRIMWWWNRATTRKSKEAQK